MTYDGEVEPQITNITLNGSDACTGSSTTTSGPQTTTPETTTTTTIASSTTASTQGPVTGTTTKAPETTTSSGSTCSAERYDYGRVLELSNLFYEAQRSGNLPDNNRVDWRGDSSLEDQGHGGEDLTGGYHDGIKETLIIKK